MKILLNTKNEFMARHFPVLAWVNAVVIVSIALLIILFFAVNTVIECERTAIYTITCKLYKQPLLGMPHVLRNVPAVKRAALFECTTCSGRVDSLNLLHEGGSSTVFMAPDEYTYNHKFNVAKQINTFIRHPGRKHLLINNNHMLYVTLVAAILFLCALYMFLFTENTLVSCALDSKVFYVKKKSLVQETEQYFSFDTIRDVSVQTSLLNHRHRLCIITNDGKTHPLTQWDHYIEKNLTTIAYQMRTMVDKGLYG